MSSKWIAAAVVVVGGIVFSTVVAQPAPEAPVAAATPAIEPAQAATEPAAPATAAPATAQATPPAQATPTQPASSSQSTVPATPSAVKTERAPNAPLTGSRGSDPQLMVLRLHNAEADTVSSMLRNLLSNVELDAVHPTVDSRANSLILRGSKEDLEKVVKLVEQLDSEPDTKRPKAESSKAVPSPARVRSVPPTNAQPAPNAGVQWSTPPYVVSPRTVTPAESKLMQDYAELDRQSMEAARALRKGNESLGEKHPQQTERRELIKSLVEKAFDLRQELQNQELKQLKERMAKVEQTLSKRAQNRAEIVSKRIKELLDEDRDLEWNASNVPGNTYAQPPGAYIQRTVTAADGRTTTVYEIDQRGLQTNYGAGGSPVTTILPSQSSGIVPAPPSLSTPQYLPPTAPAPVPATAPPATPLPPVTLPAASPALPGVAASGVVPQPVGEGPYLPAGAGQRRALADAAAQLRQLESEIQDLKSRLNPEGLEKNASYQAAVQRLQNTKRGFEALKREFEAQKTLLQLDLQAAEAEANSAKTHYAQTANLRKQNVISESEVNSSEAALKQAEIRVQRAKVLLELHQQAMQSEKSSPDATELPPTSAARR